MWVVESKGKTGTFKVELLGIFTLKEADKKRYVAFDELPTGAAFPTTIGYRFDGETLMLARQLKADGHFADEVIWLLYGRQWQPVEPPTVAGQHEAQV